MRMLNSGVMLAAALPVLLGGCAGAPTKEVVGAPEAYLSKFSHQSLDAEVLAKLPASEPPLGFSRMEIDVQISEVGTEARPARDAVTATYHFVNAGRGLVRSYDEIRSNQVPFRLNYKLSYRGLLALKSQVVFHAHTHVDTAFKVKALKKLDPVTGIDTASSLQYEATSVSEPIAGNPVDIKMVCAAGRSGAAAELHASLQGPWREISCDNYGSNGTVTSKSTYAYLVQYGVAVPNAFANSSVRHTMKIAGVRIR